MVRENEKEGRIKEKERWKHGKDECDTAWLGLVRQDNGSLCGEARQRVRHMG